MPRNRNIYHNYSGWCGVTLKFILNKVVPWKNEDKIHNEKNVNDREFALPHLDVSVKDFADAKVSSAKIRMSKNTIHPLAIETNYESLDITYPEMESKTSTKTNAAETADSAETSMIYPNEVWFLISEHIAAEDVGRFALISKQTYHITTTMKFWRNLYLRYYDANVELPMRLQKDCMQRPGGIRACTIRSLFYTYPVLVDRLNPSYYQDTDSLINRRVMNYWYDQVSPGRFRFCFKFKRRLVPGTRTYESNQLQRQNERSLASLRDVYSNSEEGCSLLIVRIHSPEALI